MLEFSHSWLNHQLEGYKLNIPFTVMNLNLSIYSVAMHMHDIDTASYRYLNDYHCFIDYRFHDHEEVGSARLSSLCQEA